MKQQIVLRSAKLSVCLQICVLLFLYLIVFGHTLAKLVQDWSSNENYSHGFLVPLIAGYMIWKRRDQLSEQMVKPSNAGFVIVAVGLLLHVLGSIGAELFTMRMALIITLYGLVLTYIGRQMSFILMLPFAYLLFVIPLPALVWNAVSFPLQLLASRIADSLLELLGIPVLREGNILHLANVSLEVVDACSGLRSLVALMALTAAFAYLSSLSSVRRWILFLSALPIALVMNVLRLALTAVLAQVAGEGAAKGFLHTVSGVFTFAGGFMLTYLVYLSLLTRRKEGFDTSLQS